jgi:hypothetical protein
MENKKFLRNYERTREYLDQFDKYTPSAILNTLYGVHPVAFEPPEQQARIRELFRQYVKRVTVFDINLMRTFVRSKAQKVAVCCMPKSGSTHLFTSLQRVPGRPKLETAYLHKPYRNPDFVGALSVEHEIDELSLLFLELSGKPWVSHMHTKWTPYTEKVFEGYGIKPIVVSRNIFDAIVSMDDMLRKGQVDGFPMIRTPANYGRIPQAERLAFLCDYVGPWYLDYVVSWTRMEGEHLKLRYETDILGFGPHTMQALRDFLGWREVTDDEFAEAFEVSDDDRRSRSRLNQGVAGRGERIPVEARDRLRRLAKIYEREVDFTGLL